VLRLCYWRAAGGSEVARRPCSRPAGGSGIRTARTAASCSRRSTRTSWSSPSEEVALVTKKTRRRLLREAQLAPPQAEALVALRATELRAAGVRLAEAGRVLSAANEEKLRTAQEAITAVL